MSLSPDQITDLERGIDAATEELLHMARQAMVRISAQHGPELAGPFIGFIQAIVEHKHQFGLAALQRALLGHPGLEEEELDD